MRMPTRKMRPAAYTHKAVAASTTATPATGCHQAMPGGTACRVIINIGVDGGKNEAAVANMPLGCSMTGTSTKSGKQATNITGSSNDCVSFMSVHAAPIAMKSEPYINSAKI